MTSRRNRRWRPILVATAGIAVFATIVAAFFMLPGRAGPVDARAALDQSLALLKAGNVSSAQAAALDAVRGDARSGAAHAVLARTQLALGDGVGAQSELQRAFENGFAQKDAHQLLAEALLLQGKNDRALAEADKTDPRYRAAGLRMRGRALAALGRLDDAELAYRGAIRAAPDVAGGWTDYGRFLFNQGNLRGAIEASMKAVALGPNDPDALILRGQLVRTQFGLTAALPWFEGVLKRDPQHHDALIEYAATLGDAGQANAMLAATRRALAARPGSVQAYYLQAVLAARAGRFELARALMERTQGVLDGMPAVLLLKGTLDLEAGANQQAVEKFQNLLSLQPMNLGARKLLAVALSRGDSARNALDVMRPLVLRGDADSYALSLVGRAFERIGDRDNAARFLDRAAYPAREASDAFSADESVEALAAAAAAHPGDPQAAIAYLRALIASGKTPQALARAQQLATANPGVANAHLVLGDVLMVMQRPADAAASYARAADLRFDEPTLLRLVEAWERAGNRQAASNALGLFLAQNPMNVAALRLTAHWQLAASDFDAAVNTLEGLRARIGDRDAALNAELAQAYAGSGDFDRALDHGEAAYRLAPSNAAAADAYGWALFKAGDARRGAELLQKAVALAPNHAGLRAHLAQALAATNGA